MIRRPVQPEATGALRLSWSVARIARRGTPRNVRAIVNRLREDAESDGRTVAPAEKYAAEIARIGRHRGVFQPRGRSTREQIVLLLQILDYLQASAGTRTAAERLAEVRFYTLISAWEPGEAVT